MHYCKNRYSIKRSLVGQELIEMNLTVHERLIGTTDCIAARKKFNGLYCHFETNTFSSPSTKSFPTLSLIVALMVMTLVDSLFPVITPSTIIS
jgi:hypothetical protein